MQKNYELYFILDNELSNEKVDEEVGKIEKILEKDLKVEKTSVEKEGLKKFAYPIKKKRSGFYVQLNFEVDYDNLKNVQSVERKLNIMDSVIRYILLDQTEYLAQKGKENLNQDAEIKDHRELNKGKSENKRCIGKYLRMRVVDYKDVDFLNQFTSPYAKIFSKNRTGTSAKMQRKIVKAIKRARHMALMPFTPKHEE